MKKWSPLSLMVLLCTAQLFADRAATITVNISNFAFDPPSATIAVGDTVTWMNSDLSAHTATSGQPGVSDGKFDSGTLAQDRSFSHTFTEGGTFPYYCVFHT